MTIFKYLKDSLKTIVCFLLILIVIDLILITSTDISKTKYDIIYMDVLCSAIFLGYLVIDYVMWNKRYTELRKALNRSERVENNLITGDTFEEQLMREIIDYKNKEKFEEMSQLKQNLDEINDYITKWVHEIKIPVSVLELLTNKIEDNKLYSISEELRREIERMNFLINQVLYISRASNYSQDFIIEEVNLKSIVKSVIQNNVNSFLSKNIEIEMDNIDYYVHTDSKWAYYVIEQITNNAFKYVGYNGKIQISAIQDNNGVTLIIRDNGMGIPQKDIDRIFDKGFTGENGRKTSKSTGMGLYICKKISENLNFDIEVSSKVSEYTEFRIIFYKFSDYLKVTKM